MPQSLDKKITTKVTYVHEQFEPFSLFCNQSWMTKIPSDYMAVNDLKQLMPGNFQPCISGALLVQLRAFVVNQLYD